MFEWSDLRQFLAVHRAGTLSAAARELAVDQTTVGRHLARLEHALGARLFERRSSGFVLTPAGRELLPMAERMEEEALSVERVSMGRDRKLEGLVRITTTEALGARFLAPRLSTLMKRYPRLQIEVLTAFRALNLSRHEADVALRILPTTQSSLFVRRVGGFASAVYASRAYVAARGAPKNLTELASHPLLGFDDSLAKTEEVRWLERARAGRPFVMRSNSTNTLLAAVRAGLGVALLPCFAADLEPDVVRVLGQQVEVTRDVWVVVHREMARVPRVRAVASFLGDVVREEQRLLMGRRRT